MKYILEFLLNILLIVLICILIILIQIIFLIWLFRPAKYEDIINLFVKIRDFLDKHWFIFALIILIIIGLIYF